MAKRVVLEQYFDTFADFWNQINPLGEIGKNLSGFIYRGEDTYGEELLPKVLRKQNIKDNEYNQILYEKTNLYHFYKEANDFGLRVPQSKYLQNNLIDKILDSDFYWIPDKFEEIAVLAQHYDTPTRLLDWTKDISVAFYFASNGVLFPSNEKTNELENSIKNQKRNSFVIYALNYECLTLNINDWRRFDDCINQKPLPIKFVTPYYAEIPNASAQSGILSYSKTYGTQPYYKGYIDNIPLDIKLQYLADGNDDYFNLNISDEEILLYKFILPKSEAINMFKHISLSNYYHSRFFPGYAGIKITMEQKELIKKYNEEYIGMNKKIFTMPLNFNASNNDE